MNPVNVTRSRWFLATSGAAWIVGICFILFIGYIPGMMYNSRFRETACTYHSYIVRMRNDCPVSCGRFVCYIPYCYHYAIVTSVQLYGSDNPWPLFAGQSPNANVAADSLQYTFPINSTTACYTDGELALRSLLNLEDERTGLIVLFSFLAATAVMWIVLELYVVHTRRSVAASTPPPPPVELVTESHDFK